MRCDILAFVRRALIVILGWLVFLVIEASLLPAGNCRAILEQSQVKHWCDRSTLLTFGPCVLLLHQNLQCLSSSAIHKYKITHCKRAAVVTVFRMCNAFGLCFFSLRSHFVIFWRVAEVEQEVKCIIHRSVSMRTEWLHTCVMVSLWWGGGKGLCDDIWHKLLGCQGFYFVWELFFFPLDICADLFTPFVPTVLTHQLLCLTAPWHSGLFFLPLFDDSLITIIKLSLPWSSLLHACLMSLDYFPYCL